MKKLAALFVAAILAIPFTFIRPAVADGLALTVPITAIAGGGFSNWPLGPADLVARRNFEFQAIWSLHAPGTTAPAVDFSQYDVYCTFMGKLSSGGVTTEIGNVTSFGNNIEVIIDLHVPGINCNVITVITNPFHIVKVPKQPNIPVRFIYNVHAKSCQ